MLQRRRSFLIAVMVIVCSLLLSLPALADSNVRIVHLSYIAGDAQVDPGGDTFTHAILNMPVTSGMWVYTPNGGRAEVQFENGSTVRLADDAQIQFEKLSMRDSGGKVNTINVDHGIVYANFTNVKSDDEIRINVGRKTIRIVKSAHLRIDASEKKVKVAVFHGEAMYDGDSPVEVKSGETLAFEVSKPEKYKVAKDTEKIGPDAWDKNRDDQLALIASKSTPNIYANSYDAQFSSLGAYGNYYNVAGFGNVWQPFGMSPGWDPYGNGAWGYYPGFGYTWISSYPWGWAPYRYGSWNYLSPYGWVWAPGNTFTAWNVGPSYGTVPVGYRAAVQPAAPTRVKGAHVLVVGNPPNVHPAILAGHANVETRRSSSGVIHPVSNVQAGRPMQGADGRFGAAAQQHPGSNGDATSGSRPAHSGSSPTFHSSPMQGGSSSHSSGGGRPK